MKRIAADEVVRAYREWGLTPARYRWLEDADDGSRVACGLGAIYYANVPAGTSQYDHPFNWAAEMYGTRYAEGFIDGFDDEPRPQETMAGRVFKGFTDGQAAWRAVVSAGLVEGERHDGA